jgi:hypothetical protein
MIGCKKSINVSRIEKMLVEWLGDKVSERVFVGNTPPATLQESWTDFLLVDCDGIRDMDAYGTGTILLYTYVKPLNNNMKYGAKFIELEDKLTALLSTTSLDNAMIRRRNTFNDYDDGIKWHFNVVELVLTIF